MQPPLFSILLKGNRQTSQVETCMNEILVFNFTPTCGKIYLLFVSKDHYVVQYCV